MTIEYGRCDPARKRSRTGLRGFIRVAKLLRASGAHIWIRRTLQSTRLCVFCASFQSCKRTYDAAAALRNLDAELAGSGDSVLRAAALLCGTAALGAALRTHRRTGVRALVDVARRRAWAGLAACILRACNRDARDQYCNGGKRGNRFYLLASLGE